MKNIIYSIMLVIGVAMSFTSCDSDANILQADETVGLYAGDVIIKWRALKEMDYEGEHFQKGDVIASFKYYQEDKDTSFVYLNISNEGKADLILAVPSDEEYELTSEYFMFLRNLPVSELGNRVATIGVTELSFGDNQFNAKTLFQPYKNADFDYVEDGGTKTDLVSGEVAFICGNYHLVLQVLINEDADDDLEGIGLDIVFDGWLNQGQDSNDLIKRRNKR